MTVSVNMELLYKKLERMSNAINLSPEDREDVLHNSAEFIIKNNLQDSVDSHLKTIVRTQILQMLRRNLFRREEVIENFDYLEGTEDQERPVHIQDTYNLIMSLQMIPHIYKKAMALYFLFPEETLRSSSSLYKVQKTLLWRYIKINKDQLTKLFNMKGIL